MIWDTLGTENLIEAHIVHSPSLICHVDAIHKSGCLIALAQ
jgi:hypothetical protein